MPWEVSELKLLAILLVIILGVGVSEALAALPTQPDPIEKPFYRKGEIVRMALDKPPDPMNTKLMDSNRRNISLAWNESDGVYSTTYVIAQDDPVGSWNLIINGGTKIYTFYVIDQQHTFIGVGVAALLAILSAVVRRYTTDIRKMRRIQSELTEFHKEMREALRLREKSKIDKLKKREAYIKKLQAEQSKDQLRFLAITFLPFLLVYYGLISLVEQNTIVAYSPIPIPLIFFTLDPPLTIVVWYIMSSIALSTVVTKLMGLGLD